MYLDLIYFFIQLVLVANIFFTLRRRGLDLGLPWVAMLSDCFLDSVSDSWSVFLELERMYFIGHGVDLPFAFAYVFYGYGLYLMLHGLKLCEVPSQEGRVYPPEPPLSFYAERRRSLRAKSWSSSTS